PHSVLQRLYACWPTALAFPNTVTRRVAMACLTHSDDSAKCVLAACSDTMDFPLTAQHSVAPTAMVSAGFHRAFTTSSSTCIHLIPEGHNGTSLYYKALTGGDIMQGVRDRRLPASHLAPRGLATGHVAAVW